MSTNKNYIIFSTDQIDKIDFSQVLETSSDTLRKSLDGSKTFVNWADNVPDFVGTLSNTEGPYTVEEMLDILSTSEWTNFKSSSLG